MHGIKVAGLGLALSLLAWNAPAQIFFQNNLSESIYVSFARFVSTGKDGYWITDGWYTMGRGSTRKAFGKVGPNDSIGFFAVTRISEKSYPGNRRLLVHPTDKFLIKNADKETVKLVFPEYEWRLFRLIRHRPQDTSGTVRFSY